MMIPHHEGVMDMARLVLIHGRDPMVRKIAEEIIASQTVEIAAMLGGWRHRAPSSRRKYLTIRIRGAARSRVWRC